MKKPQGLTFSDCGLFVMELCDYNHCRGHAEHSPICGTVVGRTGICCFWEAWKPWTWGDGQRLFQNMMSCLSTHFMPHKSLPPPPPVSFSLNSQKTDFWNMAVNNKQLSRLALRCPPLWLTNTQALAYTPWLHLRSSHPGNQGNWVQWIKTRKQWTESLVLHWSHEYLFPEPNTYSMYNTAVFHRFRSAADDPQSSEVKLDYTRRKDKNKQQ